MKSTTLNPSTATSTAGTGLCGQCYNDSSSANYPGWPVNSNKFSVKWTGQVKAPVSGNYRFTVTGDDGIRVFLNRAKVIDEWQDQGAASYSYTATLTL